MPAHHVDDPLVSLSVRIPKSLLDFMKSCAQETGVTLADQLRSRLSFDAVKPLGVPVKRRRATGQLERTHWAAPALLRQLAAIGGNLNQIARKANAQAVADNLPQVIELLVVLRVIERDFAVLIASNSSSTDAH